jgi:hypothetical protein
VGFQATDSASAKTALEKTMTTANLAASTPIASVDWDAVVEPRRGGAGVVRVVMRRA